MGNPRDRFLALVRGLTVGALATISPPSEAKLQIPLDPPISQPPPPEIAQIESSIVAALKEGSEDRTFTLADIQAKEAALASVSSEQLNIALLDLLWHKDIEEIGDGKFRLVRSGQG